MVRIYLETLCMWCEWFAFTGFKTWFNKLLLGIIDFFYYCFFLKRFKRKSMYILNTEMYENCLKISK